jgi:hypothetical protein
VHDEESDEHRDRQGAQRHHAFHIRRRRRSSRRIRQGSPDPDSVHCPHRLDRPTLRLSLNNWSAFRNHAGSP